MEIKPLGKTTSKPDKYVIHAYVSADVRSQIMALAEDAQISSTSAATQLIHRALNRDELTGEKSDAILGALSNIGISVINESSDESSSVPKAIYTISTGRRLSDKPTPNHTTKKAGGK